MSMSLIENAAAVRILLGNVIRAAESVQPDNPFGDIGHAANADALAAAGLREFDTAKARQVVAAIDDAITKGNTTALGKLAAAIPVLLNPKALLDGVLKALVA